MERSSSVIMTYHVSLVNRHNAGRCGYIYIYIYNVYISYDMCIYCTYIYRYIHTHFSISKYNCHGHESKIVLRSHITETCDGLSSSRRADRCLIEFDPRVFPESYDNLVLEAGYGYFLPSLQWRHNGRDGVLNHQPNHCLLKRLFRRRSKKTSKLRVTGLCMGDSPVTCEFPAQMASDAENVSIWWRHHDMCLVGRNELEVRVAVGKAPSDVDCAYCEQMPKLSVSTPVKYFVIDATSRWCSMTYSNKF